MINGKRRKTRTIERPVNRIFRRLRREFRPALVATGQLRALRLISIGVMLGIVAYAYDSFATIVVGIIIAISESMLIGVQRFAPGEGRDAPRWMLVTFWGATITASWTYFAPAVLIAGVHSVPLLITALLWTFGVFSHIANSYTRLPAFLWSQLVPGYVTVAFIVAISDPLTIMGPQWPEWIFAFGMLFLYYGTSTVSIAVLTRTQSALARMKIEADHRHERLRFLHRHDGLTGLLTRQAFDEELEKFLAARAGCVTCSVFNIDLDGFKPINDSYSHAAGDAVLVAVANRLRKTAPPGALVARLGGDEFAVACCGEALREGTGSEDPTVLGRLLVSAIEAQVDYDGRALRVGASIGIADSSAELHSIGLLCRAADQAMFASKSDAINRVRLYVPGEVLSRPTLQDRKLLLDAIERGEIVPHYQPKVRIATGEPCGYEALARWIHPERGLLPPGEFIPRINEMGLQGDFLHAIAQRVLIDTSDLLADGIDPGQMSINVPEVTLATLTGRAEARPAPRRLSPDPAVSDLRDHRGCFHRPVRQYHSGHDCPFPGPRRPHLAGRLRHWLCLVSASART